MPIGLAFPDKLALRSAALVRIGPPIEVDEVTPPGAGEDDHEAVRDLTELIDERLREVAPDFEDVEEWRALDLAAEIALRGHDDPDPSLVERARLARRLGRLPSEEREEIRVRLGRYLLDLHVVGLSEREVGAGKSSRELLRDAIWAGLATVILGPLALAGLVVNLIPAAIVAAVSLLVRTPVTKGTVRTLVGIIVFPVAWFAASVPVADGWAVLATAAGYAAGAAALVVVAEQAVQLLHSALAWHAVRERAGALDVVRLRRREVVEEVTRGAGGPLSAAAARRPTAAAESKCQAAWDCQRLSGRHHGPPLRPSAWQATPATKLAPAAPRRRPGTGRATSSAAVVAAPTAARPAVPPVAATAVAPMGQRRPPVGSATASASDPSSAPRLASCTTLPIRPPGPW